MAVAEFERDIIRDRVRSGLRAAKARGVRLGRPETLMQHLPRVRAPTSPRLRRRRKAEQQKEILAMKPLLKTAALLYLGIFGLSIGSYGQMPPKVEQLDTDRERAASPRVRALLASSRIKSWTLGKSIFLPTLKL
jgi:DNA invertase Pin-like site-specific DNA recombinase